MHSVSWRDALSACFLDWQLHDGLQEPVNRIPGESWHGARARARTWTASLARRDCISVDLRFPVPASLGESACPSESRAHCHATDRQQVSRLPESLTWPTPWRDRAVPAARRRQSLPERLALP